MTDLCWQHLFPQGALQAHIYSAGSASTNAFYGLSQGLINPYAAGG